MFNFSDWLTKGIVSGYKKGYTPFFKVTELTAAYFSKGLLSDSQVEQIMQVCPPPMEPAIAEEQEAKDHEN